MASKYRTYALPHDTEALTPQIVSKYAQIRLRALRECPDRIFGLEELHSAFSQSDWKTLLADSSRYYFITIANPSSSAQRDLETGTWVGMNILVGPLSNDDYEFNRPVHKGRMTVPEAVTSWHCTGVYLAPGHRGVGAFEEMVRSGLAFVKTYTDTYLEGSGDLKRGFRLRGFSPHINSALQDVYVGLGAYEAARITPSDCNHLFRKIGLDDLIPESSGEEDEYSEKSIPVMEFRGCC